MDGLQVTYCRHRIDLAKTSLLTWQGGHFRLAPPQDRRLCNMERNQFTQYMLCYFSIVNVDDEGELCSHPAASHPQKSWCLKSRHPGNPGPDPSRIDVRRPRCAATQQRC